MVERYRPLRFSRAGVRGLNVSATISVNDRVKEMWAAGKNVYHLAFGESRFPVHHKIADALVSNVQKRSYLPPLGIPELRQTVAEWYGRTYDMEVAPSQVVVGPGSKSLIYIALMVLGEEIILPQPSWVTYAPQAHLLAKPVTWIPTTLAENFRIHRHVIAERLEASHHELGNPEVLVVNSPTNPTGTMMTPGEVASLAAFARDQELMVVSDEIYSLTAFSKTPHEPFARHYPAGTLTMGGLSKSLSLGGWRLGVAVLPPGKGGAALAEAYRTVASNIWSCVPAPIQYAALAAYSSDPEVEGYIRLCAAMHATRTRFLYTTMCELGVPCAEPAGAFYVFPCFAPWKEQLAARGVHTSDDLAMHLLDDYEIATLPGSAFNAAEELCLRVSSSYIDADTDEAGAALVNAYRQDPDPDAFIQAHHPRLRQVRERFGEFIAELDG